MINGEKSDYNIMDKKNDLEHLKEQAKAFLETLTEEERKLIENFYIHEKSLKQIAEELGISEGAVRKRKFDILKRLSKIKKGKILSMLATLTL